MDTSQRQTDKNVAYLTSNGQRVDATCHSDGETIYVKDSNAKLYILKDLSDTLKKI